jgi:hypothetical protein
MILLKQGGDFGGALLSIADRIGHEPVPIVSDAETLSGQRLDVRGPALQCASRSALCSARL